MKKLPEEWTNHIKYPEKTNCLMCKKTFKPGEVRYTDDEGFTCFKCFKWLERQHKFNDLIEEATK